MCSRPVRSFSSRTAAAVAVVPGPPLPDSSCRLSGWSAWESAPSTWRIAGVPPTQKCRFSGATTRIGRSPLAPSGPALCRSSTATDISGRLTLGKARTTVAGRGAAPATVSTCRTAALISPPSGASAPCGTSTTTTRPAACAGRLANRSPIAPRSPAASPSPSRSVAVTQSRSARLPVRSRRGVGTDPAASRALLLGCATMAHSTRVPGSQPGPGAAKSRPSGPPTKDRPARRPPEAISRPPW